VRRIRSVVAATAVALVAVTLAGCPAGDGDRSGQAPPRSWPTLVDGQLTATMCGLLTKADFTDVGGSLLTPLEPTTDRRKASSNSVACVGTPGNWLRLELQPTAEAAKIRYEAGFAEHRESVSGEKLDTVLAVDVLGAAEQSWFDYANAINGHRPTDYQLVFRRAALVATVTLDGVDLSKTKDPAAALVRLAGRVLDRAADLGMADTGSTPMVRFEAKGTGRAERIDYFTGDHGPVKVENVDLPWSATVPMADHGDFDVLLSLTVSADLHAFPPPSMSCAITVGPRPLAGTSNLGSALCSGSTKVP
jgi:hypothetical protein